jgi:hypothetical protein
MLMQLWQAGSARKMRLLGAACARRCWHLLPDERFRRLLRLAEGHLDGAVADGELQAALTATMAAVNSDPEWVVGPPGANYYERAKKKSAAQAAYFAARSYDDPFNWSREASRNARLAVHHKRRGAEGAAQSDLLRCIAGNPFRPLLLPTSLLTPTILSLARAAYDERLLPLGYLDSVRLAVLADALEEAGVGEALVAHLRAPGPHVRGCHVLDMLLGQA